ncbi:MAG TPA: molecular chaperone HtpG [Kaistiaceae bacterium]|nr:molecular chaperone HtpG [Kaistiaceae bacterium]
MTDKTNESETTRAETLGFTAEVARLLHMMVHSVYSNTDVFLRELVSNASDACERQRHEALTAGEGGADEAFLISIETDRDAGRLTIRDNGIGMNRDEMIENLGRIAHSGTRAFVEKLQDGKEASELIGQFGVGFYSAFMVADEVEVTSRRAGEAGAWRWRSDGAGSYTIEPVAPEEAPARGTVVTLELKDDHKDYAAPETIERVIRTYSANVPVPIVLKAGAEDEKRLGEGGALWRKPKASIDKDEYTNFYRLVSGQYDEPALTVHYHAEGRHEYSVLTFVPTIKPFDLFDPARKGGVKLYVRRVFITDDAEILPRYLRFVRGVIDSEDLPLNISREMLQKNPILEAIGHGVTKRMLADLEKLAEAEPEAYLKIWEAFGPVIKEGLYEDPERRDPLLALARFRTTTGGETWRSLKDYVADLKENQTKIYYLLADSAAAAAASPHLEGYRKRGVEVLLLTDPVDAFWVATALGFDGKGFQSVTQGASDLDAIPAAEGEEAPKPETESAVAALAAFVKDALGDKVSDVRVSHRLADSPVCLVATDFGLDRRLEKIMATHQGGGLSAPVLELNPAHETVALIAEKLAGAADKGLIEDAAALLYGQARVLDGEAPDDPADFGRRLMRLMTAALR